MQIYDLYAVTVGCLIKTAVGYLIILENTSITHCIAVDLKITSPCANHVQRHFDFNSLNLRTNSSQLENSNSLATYFSHYCSFP